ncbi:hypothetical protein [Salininema proteolyticum]|uniref:Uncharacterized protein n=1 Tax=Salininema proteolyticum TaxID=1607685 RepID=A0ABV8U353_9ACTN
MIWVVSGILIAIGLIVVLAAVVKLMPKLRDNAHRRKRLERRMAEAQELQGRAMATAERGQSLAASATKALPKGEQPR